MKILECRVQKKKDNQVSLIYHGSIDESADFQQPPPTDEPLTIDLKGVSHLNSAGILKWIRFADTLEKLSKAPRFHLVNVPYFVADQMGKINNFLSAKMQVDSVFVPFFNPQSGNQISMLYQRGVDFEGFGEKCTIKHQTPVDKESGMELEIDVIPEVFFRFLKK